MSLVSYMGRVMQFLCTDFVYEYSHRIKATADIFQQYLSFITTVPFRQIDLVWELTDYAITKFK